jgi:hypothetical protein
MMEAMRQLARIPDFLAMLSFQEIGGLKLTCRAFNRLIDNSCHPRKLGLDLLDLATVDDSLVLNYVNKCTIHGA